MRTIRYSVLAALLLGVMSVGATDRKPDYLLPKPYSTMRVSMEILVEGVPERTITNQGRLYLPVRRMGTEYEIRVSNHGPRRVTAIVSVDGLSVIRGDPATESHPGYIVEPYGNVVIKGWRRDRETVAAFTFEDSERSYASKRGYPDNIGVIGLVAFEEYSSPIRPLPQMDRAATNAKKAESSLGGTGTGWGRDIDSHVIQVPFVRSSNKRTVTIYYDTVENLRRIGVYEDGYHPKPFPSDPEYCPPPTIR